MASPLESPFPTGRKSISKPIRSPEISINSVDAKHEDGILLA
jgi:hypothetical protein